jgi:hypothetical protein
MGRVFGPFSRALDAVLSERVPESGNLLSTE